MSNKGFSEIVSEFKGGIGKKESTKTLSITIERVNN
jgi:hypothetical protein